MVDIVHARTRADNINWFYAAGVRFVKTHFQSPRDEDSYFDRP